MATLESLANQTVAMKTTVNIAFEQRTPEVEKKTAVIKDGKMIKVFWRKNRMKGMESIKGSILKES